MEANIKPVTQVNASTKPSVHRAVSLFKAKGMLTNFLNLFSKSGGKLAQTQLQRNAELTGVHSRMAFVKLGLPV